MTKNPKTANRTGRRGRPSGTRYAAGCQERQKTAGSAANRHLPGSRQIGSVGLPPLRIQRLLRSNILHDSREAFNILILLFFQE